MYLAPPPSYDGYEVKQILRYNTFLGERATGKNTDHRYVRWEYVS